MKSQEVAADVAALLRARNPLIWIVTREEARVEGYLFEAAASAGYQTRYWDIAAGVTDAAGTVDRALDGADPDSVLTAIRTREGDRSVWVLRDLPVWLKEPLGSATLRRLRNLARFLPSQPRDRAQAVIIISPAADVPAELSNHATVIEWPLPDRAEIAELLDSTIASLPEDMQGKAVNGHRDDVIDAAVGLSGEEALATFSRSLVATRKIDATVVASEKRRVIARERVLEWFDPLPGGLGAVGGLDVLKAWLKQRATAYSPEARAYGLPAPKGAMLVGVPGCGKSYVAKAIATEWGVPLLRLDLGALRSKFVGESESNLRRALDVIAAIGRCVVWLDEIEKAMAGANSDGDSGVSADALGAILQWMQDRQGEAFVIATANNAEKLPPELLRKGRFDEVWWVDLPTFGERQGIVAAALRAHGRGEDVEHNRVNLAAVADATDTFTGAELSALIPDAMFAAFNDGMRPITTDDLLDAAGNVVPLARTASDKIGSLRAYWTGKARAATSVPKTAAAGTSRVLDLN